MQYILRTRAWIIHCGYTLLRLAYWASGQSIWLSESRSCYRNGEETTIISKDDVHDDCVSVDFNEELVERIKPAVYYTAMVLLLCSVLLDMTIYRWRGNADWIIYFEFVTSFISFAIPSSQSNYSEFYILSMGVNTFIALYTDTRWQVIAFVFAHIMFTFVMMSTIYM